MFSIDKSCIQLSHLPRLCQIIRAYLKKHTIWVQKAISFLVPKTYKTFPCRANSANSPTRQPLFDWYTSRHIWRRFCCGPTTKPGVGAWKEWSQNQKYTMNVLTLWLCQNSYWKWLFIDIYSGFSHWKWWVSIVMLVYQRVRFLEIKPWNIILYINYIILYIYYIKYYIIYIILYLYYIIFIYLHIIYRCTVPRSQMTPIWMVNPPFYGSNLQNNGHLDSKCTYVYIYISPSAYTYQNCRELTFALSVLDPYSFR